MEYEANDQVIVVLHNGAPLEMPMGEFAKSHRGRKFLDDHILYMIRGMIEVGFIPAEMGVILDQIPGGVTLDILDKISEKAGRGSGESGGVQVLMGQPLGILEQFLPKEKKTELKQLLAELTAGGREKQ